MSLTDYVLIILDLGCITYHHGLINLANWMSCPSGQEQLAGPTLCERGPGRERHQTHQRA